VSGIVNVTFRAAFAVRKLDRSAHTGYDRLGDGQAQTRSTASPSRAIFAPEAFFRVCEHGLAKAFSVVADAKPQGNFDDGSDADRRLGVHDRVVQHGARCGSHERLVLTFDSHRHMARTTQRIEFFGNVEGDGGHIGGTLDRVRFGVGTSPP
jgi:hypothetical protein